jgi:predicted HTH transcriptional regulator
MALGGNKIDAGAGTPDRARYTMSFYGDSDTDSEPTSVRSLTTPHTRQSSLPALPHGPLYINDRFPFPEGLQFEFKETWGACTTSKMHETICAFLNAAGGHLMYGIQDSGKLLGITREEADKILLRADDMFHTKKIVNCTTGAPPLPSVVSGSVIRLCTPIHRRPHPTERFVAILTVRSSDHNQTYRMSSGDVMIRLSASNYRSKSSTMSAYEKIVEDNHVLEAEKTKYYQERNMYRKEFMVMENSHRELSIAIKDCLMEAAEARKEVHTALAMLHARILCDKAEAERRLAARGGCFR